MEAIVLCGKPGRCCPTVAKKGKKFKITTDNGNFVELTKNQFVLLKEAITKLVK
jgi:hypothetical protein